jgi:hypothetical protein
MQDSDGNYLVPLPGVSQSLRFRERNGNHYRLGGNDGRPCHFESGSKGTNPSLLFRDFA